MFLVDGVVCQMRKYVFKVGSIVLLRCKTSQAFIINIKTERVYAGQGNIYTQVKLMAIYEQRVMNVLLYNALCLSCSSGHFVKGRDYLYAFALAGCFWFHYPELFLVFSHFRL